MNPGIIQRQMQQQPPPPQGRGNAQLPTGGRTSPFGAVPTRFHGDGTASPAQMRMPGPPNWINRLPAGNAILWVWVASITPKPPAIMIGLW